MAVLWFPGLVGVVELWLVGVVLLGFAGVGDGVGVTVFLLLVLVLAGVLVVLPVGFEGVAVVTLAPGVLEVIFGEAACVAARGTPFPCTTS